MDSISIYRLNFLKKRLSNGKSNVKSNSATETKRIAKEITYLSNKIEPPSKSQELNLLKYYVKKKKTVNSNMDEIKNSNEEDSKSNNSQNYPTNDLCVFNADNDEFLISSILLLTVFFFFT